MSEVQRVASLGLGVSWDGLRGVAERKRAAQLDGMVMVVIDSKV